MTANQQDTSGDLLADRRFAYAAACLADGDVAAAVDLLRQAIEIVPHWPAGWLALGEALEQAGDQDAASDAYHRAMALDGVDRLGAAARLARLGVIAPANAMAPAFVAGLFDQYAARFDAHLTGALAYSGPAVIRAALGNNGRFALALDLGCGTGLMAREMANNVGLWHGVDLSPRMVERARATGLYAPDGLHVGEAVEHLHGLPAAVYPLVLAADVLVYLGDLAPLFRAVVRVLTDGGLFAFTVQSEAGDGYRMGHDLRYHHSEAYLRRIAEETGLSVISVAPCSTRQDGGVPVPGFVCVMGTRHGA